MKVIKTIKLYINGDFVRTESGRSSSMYKKKNGKATQEQYARICMASRKDFRNAVEFAKGAQQLWAKRTAFNRGQILYRMAEMMEGKKEEFSTLFQDALGWTKKKSEQEVAAAINTVVYYAGFSDKYQQLIGTVNPVSGPYHNFTTPEAVGVVAHVDSQAINFPKLMNDICSIIVSGNSVITLLGKECPTILAPLSEVFATCDLPKGVVNLLSGDLHEVSSIIATHREVRSLCFSDADKKLFNEMKANGVDNMKRSVFSTTMTPTLESILNFVEFKTIWHPIGL